MQYIINNDFNQVRIDRWLKKTFPGIPQGLIERYLRNKDITLNGAKVKSSTRLTEGDSVLINKHVEIEDSDSKIVISYNQKDYSSLRSQVIFENDDYIVFNKAPGFAVQGGTAVKKSIIDILNAHEPLVGYKIVHRLDKSTSGILIMAKSYPAARYFAELFASHNIQKTYLAVVDGQVSPKSARLEDMLLKVNGEVIISPDGKKAITDYKVLAINNNQTLLELKPLTGRMHQLRVQLANHGFSIKGDYRYNLNAEKDSQLFLHAYKIEFLDLNQKTAMFKASIPGYFRQIFDLNNI